MSLGNSWRQFSFSLLFPSFQQIIIASEHLVFLLLFLILLILFCSYSRSSFYLCACKCVRALQKKRIKEKERKENEEKKKENGIGGMKKKKVSKFPPFIFSFSKKRGTFIREHTWGCLPLKRERNQVNKTCTSLRSNFHFILQRILPRPHSVRHSEKEKNRTANFLRIPQKKNED